MVEQDQELSSDGTGCLFVLSVKGSESIILHKLIGFDEVVNLMEIRMDMIVGILQSLDLESLLQNLKCSQEGFSFVPRLNKNSHIVISVGVRMDLLTNTNEHGWYPLGTATLTGNLALVRTLLYAGVDVEKIDTFLIYSNALQFAVSRGQTEIRQLLVQFKTNVNHMNIHRENVLDSCLRALESNLLDGERSGELLLFLLGNGAEI
ncbi:hypothetical protein QAD02_000748 [Eretmocerus hayati]|uniref:Uncharacterized protein n=1 Tax=Eretmocerus hayati TaxID=131215 RepID=A0ACC2NE28_9HYME|nr:hypothetical protein QAD02_000748 [Eretmocerus hayati]